eukprot:Skav221273  [mRNA]  locus=scaffold2775:36412:37327:+ [translate_table: standard]
MASMARAKPIFDATRARKKAEQDSILLANRIRMLRAEDARTRKKIVETEKKTQEIILARQRKEQQRHEKEVFEAQKEERKALGGSVLRSQRLAHRQVVDLERQASQDEAFARAEQVRSAMDRAARSRARSEGAKQDEGRWEEMGGDGRMGGWG